MHERIKRVGRRLAVAGFVASGAYYGLFGGVYNVLDIHAMQTDRAALVDRVDLLVSLTDSLVHRGDSLIADPDAIERVAREEFGFIRDGELLIRFVPHSETVAAGVDD